MRLLWFSNTPLAGTGYGVQTAEVVPRLKAAGHDVAVACNWGHYGTPIEWNGIPLLPAGKDKYSNDIALAHHASWKADWTITLYDVWPLVRERFPENTASWVPVDHQPVPPTVAQWCKSIRPIAMSRFGQRELRQQGIESFYIPHSINTEIFRPTEVTPGGHKPRQALNIPDDAYVVLIAAANQGGHHSGFAGGAPARKAWGEMFIAAATFLASHPDAYLYVHTDRQGIGGVDLSTLERAVGLPLDRVRYTDPYSYASGRVSQGDLAAIYSMADVMISPSMGEGFGVPVIEAQACGLPVIVSDFSAQPELCNSGWLVNGQLFWDDTQSAWFFMPYVGSILKRLEEAYAARGDNGLRERAVAFAAQYDSDSVFERFWVPFLNELQAVQPLNRAERRRRKKAAA